ncbi:hypothetical protein [Halorussus ruber]|uniref:hypothetical protein n=1 Tax=Halorussus ruber TaxID=1126238 RepID=UPI00109195B3|nr:hypothetical protein [Halorussus ruber]
MTRFKIGVVKNPEEIPSLQEFDERDEIADSSFPIQEERDGESLRKGFRDPYYEDGDDDTQEFFYFDCVIETLEKNTRLDEDGNDLEHHVQSRDTMHFILLPDGRFIYESAKNVGPGNALRLLLGEIPEIESDITIPHSVLRNYYFDKDEVSKVVVNGIESDDDPEEYTEPVRSILRTGRMLESTTFNTGDFETNLRESDLVGSFIDHGNVKFIKGSDEDTNTKAVSNNGWVRFYLPTDRDVVERSRLIHRKVRPILDDVI